MNRSQHPGSISWNKVKNSGGIFTLYPNGHSPCYLIIQVKEEDKSLRRVGLFSERYPTFSRDMGIPVEVQVWFSDNYHNASRKASQEIRSITKYKWAWIYINDSLGAYKRRYDLFQKMKGGEIPAPASLEKEINQAMKENRELHSRLDLQMNFVPLKD